MTKDCDNCQHHLQGRTLDDCPAICWDCFDHTTDPMTLRNWTPRVEASAKPCADCGRKNCDDKDARSCGPSGFLWVPQTVKPEEFDTTVVHRGLNTMTLALTPKGANDKQVAGNHYKNMGVEPWDVVDTWPLEQQVGVYRHGVLKYTMRMGYKDARVQEVQKALHYAEKLVEVLKKAAAEGSSESPAA